ncbi:hypothetical protein BGW42_006717 [Actinomortierella wolfii]|nr:hypothetical protein BGW42_006717 [Actinomortierella wolfii]
MTKKNKTSETRPANVRSNSSASENSDVEDRQHSRTSTSSVEEEHIKSNGHAAPASNGPAEVEANGTSSGFFAKVAAIPLVQDSVTYAKESKYGKYAIDTASSAALTVSKYTEPVQKTLQPHLQPHLTKVDELATKSLEYVEHKFPIVTQPTTEIVTQVKKPITYVEVTSKNAYTQLQSTIDERVTTPVKTVTSSIASKANATRTQITNAASTTVTNIQTAATSTATTIQARATTTAANVAQGLNTRATPLIDGFEKVVDHYLPAEEDTKPSPQSNQAARVVELTRSVSTRVTRKVASSPIVQGGRRRVENSAAINKSKESVQQLNARLAALVETLRLQAKELQENVSKIPSDASAATRTRVQHLNSAVLAQIDSLSVYLKEKSPSLPESVQRRLEPLKVFITDRYVTVKGELAKKDITLLQKTRNILQLTTEETLPILQNAAKDIRESLASYQVAAQENIQVGINKAKEVNSTVVTKVQDLTSSIQAAVARTMHGVHVIAVGK